jgi:hypothetical protein
VVLKRTLPVEPPPIGHELHRQFVDVLVWVFRIRTGAVPLSGRQPGAALLERVRELDFVRGIYRPICRRQNLRLAAGTIYGA